MTIYEFAASIVKGIVEQLEIEVDPEMQEMMTESTVKDLEDFIASISTDSSRTEEYSRLVCQVNRGDVAQWTERLSSKQVVGGSTPSVPAKQVVKQAAVAQW